MFFLNFCGMYGGRAGLVYEVGIVHCLLIVMHLSCWKLSWFSCGEMSLLPMDWGSHRDSLACSTITDAFDLRRLHASDLRFRLRDR